MFYHCRKCVTDFRKEVFPPPTPHTHQPGAALEKPILNGVKNLFMTIFFYLSTAKEKELSFSVDDHILLKIRNNN